MNNLLEELGLSEREIKVYKALLSAGLSSVGPVIKMSGIPSSKIYETMDKLIEKGLVSFIIESNIKKFKAADPKILLNFLEEKEEQLKKEIIPQLQLLQKHHEEQDATIFRGIKGIKTLTDDMLTEKKEILTIGSSDINAKTYQYYLDFNLPVFHSMRIKNKIPIKITFSENMKDRARKLGKMAYTKARYLPKEFISNSSVNIYGNKVSIIFWGADAFGIIIKSKNIADFQRKYFNLLWKQAKL